MTQDTHLGLYRNYFGQDIDDTSSPTTSGARSTSARPAATDPPDYTCPAAQQGVATGPGRRAARRADERGRRGLRGQLGAADRDHAELAFNAIGACTAATAADESSANCTGSYHRSQRDTYTDPGQVWTPATPTTPAFVNALLADKADFNWITHTWSHQFLGCTVWQPQPLTSVTASGSGGTLHGRLLQLRDHRGHRLRGVGAVDGAVASPSGRNGSVTLTWPEATNGTGTDGNAGPTLAQEEANHTGGTGFWGYNIYRENPGSTTYGLVGQVPENPPATSSTTYSFTDTGTAPGAAPNSGPDFPTATNPGIDCSSAAGSWLPATSTAADASIDQEIGLDQAFAAANGLTNYTPAAVVTGEHSGRREPQHAGGPGRHGRHHLRPGRLPPAAAVLARRRPGRAALPEQHLLQRLQLARRAQRVQHAVCRPGRLARQRQFPSETGHCADTSATTCRTTPATEADLLASESHIMLSHVLANDPRVGYAHQSDLIGPATQNGQDYGYTILLT